MKSKDILQEPLYKLFFRYVSFSALSMLGVSLYVLADTFFIANGVGQKGLAALNVVIPLFSLMSGTGLLLGMGGATLYSISQGKGKTDRGNQIFSFTIILGSIVGSLLTILGLLFREPFLKTLGATGEIYPLAKSYFTILVSFSSFFILNFILTSFVRNDGSPNIAMISMLVGSFLNIILDYIFIFPLQMGMAGAAWATITSPIIGLIILLTRKKTKKNSLAFISFKAHFSDVLEIASIGFPALVTEFSTGLVVFLFNRTILQLVGTIGVASYGILTNISFVGISLFTGIGQGIQPLASISFGARNSKRVFSVLLYGFILAMGLGIFYYIISFLFGDQIISFFNNEKSSELAEITKWGFQIYFVSFFFMGANIVSIAFFSAVAKVRQSFLLSLLRGILLIIPFVIILPHYFGMTGVWLVVPITEGIVFIITLYFLRRYFKNSQGEFL
ncbi:MATE family efflux transporter [Jeotgalibaca sp. MA1X17-3]|uniref:MATE family efflux transporter n=1 Tax=Jeotgalibaca sp. MA1X17-3 TaxID=2908211 RepID=UPI001F3BA2F4|nr:MATE family efflux transporter [Jeotgalibaca sp. MA1X17-3]UJF15899.1 MATE family efflux transporter [Jeotgalibaca sp. MA1X17-3]